MSAIEDAASAAQREFIEAEAFAFAAALLRAMGDQDQVDRATDALEDRIPDGELMSTVYMTATEMLAVEVLPRLATERRIGRVADFLEESAKQFGWEPTA